MTSEKSQHFTESTAKQRNTAASENESVTCPHCLHDNDCWAKFCEECGGILGGAVNCARCGSQLRKNADICEMCGDWQLKGQCVFCYATVNEEETYCGECGNPAGGITCPQCDTLSYFDFCSHCNIPLSHQANEVINEPATAALGNKLASLLMDGIGAEAPPPDLPVSPETNKEIEALRAYRQSLAVQSSAQPKPLFGDRIRTDLSRLNDEIVKEEARKRQEEERKRQEEERKQQELMNLLNQMRSKTFSSNQEARRYFMSAISGFPKELSQHQVDNRLKWRCNAFGAVHNHPGECGDPSQGGVWLIS